MEMEKVFLKDSNGIWFCIGMQFSNSIYWTYDWVLVFTCVPTIYLQQYQIATKCLI